MAAGTGAQIGQKASGQAANRAAIERQAASRAAERQRQQGYQQETMDLARQQLAGFTPEAWTQRMTDSFDKLAPAWEANATGAQFGADQFAGQNGAPAIVADQLLKRLDAARAYGAAKARARAKIAAAEDQDFGVKADALDTANRIAAVRDFAGSSGAMLPNEQAIAGYVPEQAGGLGDLLVGAGSLGLAAKAGGLIGGPSPVTGLVPGWKQGGGK